MEYIGKKPSKRFLKFLSLLPCIAIVMTCTFLLASCGSGYDTDMSTVFVEDDGKIVTVDVEAFDEGTYDKKELESYVQESINGYNAENAKSIKKKKISVKDNIATLVLEFANQTAYQDFYGVEFFTGTVAEAKENGYPFDVVFAKLSDGKAVVCETEEIVNSGELKVVIIKANTTVQVDGEILYVSAENISQFGTNSVSIQSGSHILDVETADTQNTQNTQGTEGTENDESTEDEGSVGEDELLISAEETVEFDFGDSETETATSQLSDVYTYIIYK